MPTATAEISNTFMVAVYFSCVETEENVELSFGPIL